MAAVPRNPSKLVLIDTPSGAVTASFDAGGDPDNEFFDSRLGRFYVSCGSGEVDKWQYDKAGYRALPHTKTDGGARTSLFMPERFHNGPNQSDQRYDCDVETTTGVALTGAPAFAPIVAPSASEHQR